jgi:hypothetical protein
MKLKGYKWALGGGIKTRYKIVILTGVIREDFFFQNFTVRHSKSTFIVNTSRFPGNKLRLEILRKFLM